MSDENFILDIDIDDSVIDDSIRKLRLYESQLKRISRLSKRSGSGILTGGAVGAGSVGGYAGSLAGSQMLTQLSSQVGALKLGQAVTRNAQGGFASQQQERQQRIPRINTNEINQNIRKIGMSSSHRPALIGMATANVLQSNTRERNRAARATREKMHRAALTPLSERRSDIRERLAIRNAENAAQRRLLQRRMDRRQERNTGARFGRAAGGGAGFATAGRRWFGNRGRQIGDMFGKGAVNTATIARSAGAGVFRQAGSLLGRGLGAFGGIPGFIVGGMIGASIGGLGDRLMRGVTEQREIARNRTRDIEEASFRGVSNYIKEFSTPELRRLKNYDSMAAQTLKDGISTWTWWGSKDIEGFRGPGWSNARVRKARKQAETEFSRRKQGIVDIDETEMNYDRIEQTLRMLVRQ